jgi:hypothetical protein
VVTSLELKYMEVFVDRLYFSYTVLVIFTCVK